MALVTISIAAFAAWSVFYVVANRAQAISHSASWQEALIVAESGADTGMSALNTASTSPGTAWNGWKLSDGTACNATNTATYPKTYTGTFPVHSGDGNNKMYVKVTIDNAITDGTNQVWYRIRSRGTVELPGLHRVGYEPAAVSTSGKKNHLNALRKLSFNSDVTGGALHAPQVSRSVEVIAQPLTAHVFGRGMAVQRSISMSGSSYVDSFDSSDPAKSTNGQYDPAKRQNHGDIATNSSGNLSDLKRMYVYGNAYSNGGAFSNTQNVQGSIYNNFSASIAPVSDPSLANIISSPSAINNPAGGTTLTAGSAAAPANYKVTQLNISQGSNPLVLAPPSPDQESYINIWVTGDITTSGSGFIQILPGVHATIWVDGNVNVSGSAWDNQNGYASYLTINGVTDANGKTNNYTVSGKSTFVGVVNAPSYDLTVSGSGDFTGALIMRSANFNGSANYHYDEALGQVAGGNGQGYKVASWIEDIK